MGNAQFFKDAPIIPGSTPALPQILYQSYATVTEGDAATENCAAIVIPAQFLVPGSTFRVTMTGNKDAGNGSMGVQLSLGATAVLTITADAVTAADYVATMTLVSTGAATQKAFGALLQDTEDPATDYATAAVNTSNEITLYVQMINGHATDNLTCEYVLVEYWKY